MSVEISDTPTTETGAEALPRQTRALAESLLNTCRVLVESRHQQAFEQVAGEIWRSIEDTCGRCATQRPTAAPVGTALPQRDPRRQRCLLRLVVGRFSALFLVDNALFPRSIVEGFDVYLKRALGEYAYGQLNHEADGLLATLCATSDQEMWERIYGNVDWRHWADTIFIRILLRFSDFDDARQHLIGIVDATTVQRSDFSFKAWHFTILFDSLFGEVYRCLAFDDQRAQWEVLFGDGTADALIHIFRRFADESLGSLLRYQKISGYQPKFAIRNG